MLYWGIILFICIILFVVSLKALNKSCKNVTLYMPYCPHARMDRVKGATDVFTLKSFADVINSLDGQSYEDELTWADHLGEDNLLQPVFRDGNMIKEDTLHDIRARLYKEGF